MGVCCNSNNSQYLICVTQSFMWRTLNWIYTKQHSMLHLMCYKGMFNYERKMLLFVLNNWKNLYIFPVTRLILKLSALVCKLLVLCGWFASFG